MVIDKISIEISGIPPHDLLNNNNPNIPINQLPQTDKDQPHPICYCMARKTISISVNPPLSLSRNGQRLSQIEMCFSRSTHFRNLGNLLVHTSLTKHTPNKSHLLGYSSPCKSNRRSKLCPSMSNTNSVTNHLTNKTSYTAGGKCSTKYTIYAAECAKNNLLYIGQSSQKLNNRFNGHRSDVRVKPKVFKLTQHFSQSKNCKIDNDLECTFCRIIWIFLI